jgi:hypothetical protein
MKGNMALLPTSLSGTSYDCPTNCDALMYQAPNYSRVLNGQVTAIGTYYGRINAVTISNRTFYIDEESKNLYWDVDMAAASKQLIFTAPFGYVLNGLAVNKNTRRLFLSYSSGIAGQDKVDVYDIGPALDLLPSNPSSAPTLHYTMFVNHPTKPGQVTLPSEMALASKTGRTDQVFVYLRGSGGVLVIADPSDRAILPGDFQFAGLDTISASPSDVPNTGLKIGYDPVSDNIIGVSRGGRQIYTVNPDNRDIFISAHAGNYTTAFVTASDVRIDSLMIMPMTGSIYFVDRKNSFIFRGR